ncbi:hypothetical protein [Caenimonas sedimenti]|uniref:hypothetical protein n=1 Tax=Caenimonas sedimenti TaxID=2596921 RepID=UPI001646D228|nr:hypothetical protein [Caenimonas sedimenti]
MDDLKPDLLVHDPGDMGGNFAVIEVKPAEASTRGFEKDLRTLGAFLAHGEYKLGILLVYGDESRAPRLAARVGQVLTEHPDQSIELWWHRAAKRCCSTNPFTLIFCCLAKSFLFDPLVSIRHNEVSNGPIRAPN